MGRSNFEAGARGVETLESRALLTGAAVPVGPEFLVNAQTVGDQHLPAVASDADGDFVVAWQSDGQDESSNGIYARRFNALGVPKGPEFRVNTHTTGAQTDAAVAMDNSGKFVVAWTSEDQDGDRTGAFAQRFAADGTPQGGEFRVNTYTPHEQDRPRVAMDQDGDFVIAWNSFNQDGQGEGVFAQRYNAGGVPQGSEFRVNTHTPSHQFHSAVAMDDTGDFVVAWTSNYQDGQFYGVYAQRYSASGAPQGGEFRVNTHTLRDQGYPSVATDADGDFVVAWSSYDQDGSHWGAYAQRFDASGAAEGAEFRASQFTTGAQFLAVVAMDADGDFAITWTGRNADSHSEVMLRQYDAAGVPRGDEVRVNAQVFGFQQSPALAMDADGDFVLAFSSQYQDGDGYGIFAQRYAVPPSMTSSAFEFLALPHRLSLTFDRDVSASLGSDDLLVQNLTTVQTIPADQFTVTYQTSTNTATFRFTGSGGGITGVLPDGRCRATLLAAGITSTAGASMAADQAVDFFFLSGDATRDGRVNLNDFNVLAANFGQSNRVFTQGDFDYSGNVNLTDFNILAARFGAIIGPATGVVGRNGDSDDETDELPVGPADQRA